MGVRSPNTRPAADRTLFLHLVLPHLTVNATPRIVRTIASLHLFAPAQPGQASAEHPVALCGVLRMVAACVRMCAVVKKTVWCESLANGGGGGVIDHGDEQKRLMGAGQPGWEWLPRTPDRGCCGRGKCCIHRGESGSKK